MKKRKIFVGSALALVFFSSCANQKAQESTAKDSSNQTTSNIKLTIAKQGVFVRKLKLPGSVISSPNGVVNVTSSVNGVIERVLVNIGEHVGIGQPLFLVKSADVANLYSNYLQAKAQYELALKTYDLTKKLYEIGSMSKFDLDNALANLKSSKALMDGYYAQMKIIGLKGTGSYVMTKYITSPADGVVAKLNIHPGEKIIVDPYTPLATIVDTSHVMVVADAFSKDIKYISPGQKVEITTSAYPGISFEGKVFYVGDIVDPNTRTYKVYIRVKNIKNFLKPNMFVDVDLTSSKENSIEIPQSALVFKDNQFYVFKYENGTYVKTPVEVYKVKGQTAYIKSGLNPGDKVVASGTILISK
ncbi:efflux RND transporter periplasmic adaptor subunit [Hydrogenobaculum acidophilum]